MTDRQSDVYATVIVPTLDRASTLAASINSIRAQTVQNIEIVVSGDGASAEVRAIALRLAETDARIVFHDFPKAPKRGGENRDRAVRLAKSERIFYCDDDDLLLPRHIETLGPLLDHYDAADSAPAFVSSSGSLQIGLVNHERGAMREALAAATAKTAFDTHFAHRKSAYQRLGSPWALNGNAIAQDFFQKFAADASLRWRSVPTVTALSFNGRSRQHLLPKARQNEIEYWQKNLGSDSLIANAFYDWQLFSFASRSVDSPRALEELASAAYFDLNDINTGGPTDISYSIPEVRLTELRVIFDLLREAPTVSPDVGHIAARLADPLIGWARPNLDGRVGALLKRALGAEGMRAALRDIDDTDLFASEMRAFLECWLLLSEDEPASALHLLNRLIVRGAFFQSEAYVQAAVAYRRMGDVEGALDMASMAIRLDPTFKVGHELVVKMLLSQRRFDAARDVSRNARPFLPEHVASNIIERIDQAEIAFREYRARKRANRKFADRTNVKNRRTGLA
jgi:glycosyltransferase involved in cell wall biosynthesis